MTLIAFAIAACFEFDIETSAQIIGAFGLIDLLIIALAVVAQ